MAKRRELTPAELEANYQYWLSSWNPLKKPGESITSLSAKLIATHACPYNKPSITGPIFYYRLIFGYNEKTGNFDRNKATGILSRRNREGVKPKGAKQTTAEKLGHDVNVFAYLGGHLPYYGQREATEFRPFGFFIKQEAEKNIGSHASARDIAAKNTKVIRKDLKKYSIAAQKSRNYVAYKIQNDDIHLGPDSKPDFWHYYGDVKYWKDKNYSRNSWMERCEMRYLEKIGVDDILAILWPVWPVLDKTGSRSVSNESCHTVNELPNFRTEYKHIDIILYEPFDSNGVNSEEAFIEASTIAFKYLEIFKRFPDNIMNAKTELKYE